MQPLVHDAFSMIFLLLVGHALADYPLQTEFLATAKDRSSEQGREFWLVALGAHGLIHGGFVAIVTGSAALGAAETVIHALIDHLKCRRLIGLKADQAIHVTCKLLWTALMPWVT
jgi:hypothetical protein